MRVMSPSPKASTTNVREPWRNLRVGTTVRSLSGLPLGTVVALRRTGFRLDGVSRRVWIVRDAVFTVDDDDNAFLVCERAGLGQFVDLPTSKDQ